MRVRCADGREFSPFSVEYTADGTIILCENEIDVGDIAEYAARTT